ncbi:hypothetical protein [Butyrivibrio sp.]|uniref:hypothetical protein n=1 Tax=Butyrivibrio sp. TaxID=28121 RepID=UPI0025C36792|nr:hypothetical protein [Butyrivibrio sp.]MBQ9304358.1 hypothetical protein [Butyrivibrio sp.]
MIMSKESKYINNIEERVFYGASVVFILATIIMPPYFGIPVPAFDLTAIRIMIIVLMILICNDRDRLYDFLGIIKYNKGFLAFLPYIFVITYTTVLRVDVKAFLNPFTEIFTMFLMIYVVDKSLGIEKIMSLVYASYYIFVIQGIAEYFHGKSFFKYLRTLDGALVGGSFVRAGQYRIMGPAAHSIAYGMILTVGIPLIAMNFKEKKMYIFQRPVLFILMFVNIIFTGSRSALAVFFLEVALIFLLSNKEEKKKTLLVGSISLLIFGTLIVASSGTSIGRYFMLQITSVIDEIFGTTFSLNYGATLITQQSSDYRDALWYVFKVHWLNPILGIGRKRSFSTVINGVVLRSVDNYYIAEYIRYAYPGMFSYIFYLLYILIKMLIRIIRENDVYAKVAFIAVVSHAVSLYYVDSLGTLKFTYLVIAMYICHAKEDFIFPSRHKKSKYMRQAI